MKRIIVSILIVLCLCNAASAALTYGASYYQQHIRDCLSGSSNTDPIYLVLNEIDDLFAGADTGFTSLIFTPGTAPTTANEGEVYYNDAGNTLMLYTGSAWVTIDTAGASSLDTAYGAGNTIDVDGDAVTLTTSDTDDNVVLAIVQNEATNDNDAVTITMGTGATGSGLTINSQTSGTDITGDNWSVAQTGIITSVGTIVGASGLAGTQSDTITNETNNTWTFDSDTATTEDFSIGLGANTNIITFSSASSANTLELGTVDDVNGVGNIYFDSAASQITLAANAAADDLLIQVSGAQNASLDLRSAGTGTDAVKVYASAGGIDVDGTGSTIVMTNTADGSDDDFTIEVAGTQDASLILQSAGTGGDAVSIITSNAAGDIKIASGDMIDIDAADDILIDLAGAAGEDIIVTNTGGSIALVQTEAVSDGINIDATGGVDIDSALDVAIDLSAAGSNFDVDSAAGSVYLDGGETAADAVKLHASATAGGIDIDSGTGGIAIDSTGVISIDGADDMNFTLTTSTDAEDLTIQVDGDDDSSIIIDSDGTGADAVSIAASNAAGGINIDAGTNGIDVDVTGGDILIDNTGAGKNLDIDISAGSIYLDAGEAAANAIALLATGGGIDLTSTATYDIDITATGGKAIITANENAAGAITITTAGGGGTSESIDIVNDTGSADDSIDIDSTAGGLDVDVAKSLTLSSSEGSADSVVITSTGGGIDILAVTTNAAGEDIDITLSGATDSSIDLNSSGTGADAIILAASAGGLDIDAATDTIHIQNAADGDADDITIAMTGAHDTSIILDNTQGTGADAISLQATAGSIDIDAVATGDITVNGGQIILTAEHNTAGAIQLVANTGSSETITVTNTQGSAAGAIALESTAGGITAKVCDEKELKIGNNGLDAYLIVAASATAGNEDIRLVNTNGTDNGAIELTSTAGGILAKVADEKTLVVGNAASDAHFTVAASATAGNEDVRMVNTNGTDAKAVEILASAGGVAIECADEKEAYIGNDAKDAYFTVAASATAGSEDCRIVNTNGTDNGAIELTSTAGGIDINAKEMLTLDVAAGTAATADIIITNTPGTDEAAIAIQAVAGGVDIDAAGTKDVAVNGGQILLTAAHDVADAVKIHADAGSSQTLVILNDEGTDEAAINIDATAGGIDIDAAATKDIALTGGQIVLASSHDTASAISLTANTGSTETIVVTNTQGTAAGAITLTSTAGGITVSSTKALKLEAPLCLNDVRTISQDDATPDVSGYSYFNTGTNADTIDDFDGTNIEEGQILVVVSKAAITYDVDGGALICGTTDLVTASGDVTVWIYDGTNWLLISWIDNAVDQNARG